MNRVHTYRCVEVTTHDYGDGPSAGKNSFAHLSVIADGSDWRSRPTTLKISVPVGTRPGDLWTLTLEKKGTDNS